MSMTMDQIVTATRRLPREQIAELVDRLTLELTQGIDPAIGQEWADTAARRLAELNSGQVKPIPGEKVMARARKIVGL
jgi:hypothetical protein